MAVIGTMTLLDIQVVINFKVFFKFNLLFEREYIEVRLFYYVINYYIIKV